MLPRNNRIIIQRRKGMLNRLECNSLSRSAYTCVACNREYAISETEVWRRNAMTSQQTKTNARWQRRIALMRLTIQYENDAAELVWEGVAKWRTEMLHSFIHLIQDRCCRGPKLLGLPAYSFRHYTLPELRFSPLYARCFGRTHIRQEK